MADVDLVGGTNWFQRVFDPTGSNMKYNALEAEKQRDFEERMSNTQYERAFNQLTELGLNPYELGSSSGSVPSAVSASNTTSGTSEMFAGLVKAITTIALTAITKIPPTVNKIGF